MGWLSRLLGTGAGRRDLIADLVEGYRAEAEHAAHLREHAARARYPQAADSLRTLADQEDRHAAALSGLIQSIGGGLPPIAPDPIPGQNQWARAVAAHEAARRKRQGHLTRLNYWDPEHPKAVAVLRTIEREDAAVLRIYDDLIMRSDPQSRD